jgi:hypothetical protein
LGTQKTETLTIYEEAQKLKIKIVVSRPTSPVARECQLLH